MKIGRKKRRRKRKKERRSSRRRRMHRELRPPNLRTCEEEIGKVGIGRWEGVYKHVRR